LQAVGPERVCRGDAVELGGFRGGRRLRFVVPASLSSLGGLRTKEGDEPMLVALVCESSGLV